MMFPCLAFLRIFISRFTLRTSACSLILLFSRILIATYEHESEPIGFSGTFSMQLGAQCTHLLSCGNVDCQFHFTKSSFTNRFADHILTNNLSLGFRSVSLSSRVWPFGSSLGPTPVTTIAVYTFSVLTTVALRARIACRGSGP